MQINSSASWNKTMPIRMQLVQLAVNALLIQQETEKPLQETEERVLNQETSDLHPLKAAPDRPTSTAKALCDEIQDETAISMGSTWKLNPGPKRLETQ
jgi:hypothetical protein